MLIKVQHGGHSWFPPAGILQARGCSLGQHSAYSGLPWVMHWLLGSQNNPRKLSCQCSCHPLLQGQDAGATRSSPCTALLGSCVLCPSPGASPGGCGCVELVPEHPAPRGMLWGGLRQGARSQEQVWAHAKGGYPRLHWQEGSFLLGTTFREISFPPLELLERF